ATRREGGTALARRPSRPASAARGRSIAEPASRCETYTQPQVAKVEKRRALSTERLRELLREMLLIRRFEEKVEERFRAGELPGFLHVAIGQEASEVGVCEAMEDGDVFGSTHRA